MSINKNCYAAIDLGASSGRVVIGQIVDKKIQLHEVYRFDNIQIRSNGHDCWDINMIFSEILKGLAKCRDLGFEPKTVGIDTWGVDFVLLDKDDNIIGDAVAYRDQRTTGMIERLGKVLPFEDLYKITGIAKQPFNTIYQLFYLKQEEPEQIDRASSFLMIPDYLNFLLTGKKVNEYTNMSTTSLLNAKDKKIDDKILDVLGIEDDIFCDIVEPGYDLGCVLPDIEEKIGYKTRVVVPATHDTGSAYISVPLQSKDSVILSSGTWSLLGVENTTPITTSTCIKQNFTNEGGYGSTYRFLKNIMGLWIIQCVRRELNGVDYVKGSKKDNQDVEAKLPIFEFEQKSWGFGDLIDEASKCKEFSSIIDVNDERFLSPVSMIDEIRCYCLENNLDVPANVGELMQCIYLSLATYYKKSIKDLSQITNKTYTSLNIVGGGCQDNYLNSLTAKIADIDVYAGPIEATSLGNLAIQMIKSGEFKDISNAREAIKESFDIEKF